VGVVVEPVQNICAVRGDVAVRTFEPREFSNLSLAKVPRYPFTD
jgi:hypothetical protein